MMNTTNNTPLQQLLIKKLWSQDENIEEIIREFSELDKQFTDEEQNSPLHIACLFQNEKIIKFLLKNGFGGSLYLKNSQGLTPLHILCSRKSTRLSHEPQKLDVSLVSETEPAKSLFFAATVANFSEAHWGSEKLELPDLSTQNIYTPKSGNHEKDIFSHLSTPARLIYLLRKYEASNNQDNQQLLIHCSSSTGKDKGGALHLACRYLGKDDTVMAALLGGVSDSLVKFLLLQKNHEDETPLHLAARYASAHVILLLLEKLLISPYEEPTNAFQSKEDVGEIALTHESHAEKITSIISSGMILGGTATLLATLPAALLFPPLGVATLVGGFAIFFGGLGVDTPNTKLNDYLSKAFEGKINLLQLIAKDNEADVMREFCKKVPAAILFSWLKDKTPGTHKSEDLIKHRNNKHPLDYNLSEDEFKTLVRHQLCFLTGLNYLIEKRKELYEKKHPNDNDMANFEVRMGDFCGIVTLFTEFFIKNEGKPAEAIKDEFKQVLDNYRHRNIAIVNRMKETKHFRSTERYKIYRERLLQLEPETLLYRFNEFCMTIFNSSNTNPEKHVADVINEIKVAFNKGGYNPALPQAASEESSEEETTEKIIITPSMS